MNEGLRYAYNTNGCANHRLYDAIDLITDAGYAGIALTLDWQHLDPFADDWERQSEKLAKTLGARHLGSIIETGARYLLNPKMKHEPTLINPLKAGRNRRINFLKRAIDIAHIMDAEAVSFWSGIKMPDLREDLADNYLIDGLNEVAEYAHEKGVSIALEPEPGMWIETMAELEGINEYLTKTIPLALDVGHVWVTGEIDPVQAVLKYGKDCGTVAIEGMNRGAHVHLPIHEGDMDVAGLVAAFQQIEFQKLISVELSRESHRAHQAIFETIENLRSMEKTHVR